MPRRKKIKKLSLGTAIQAIRHSRNMTQAELRKHTGFTINYISCLETSRKNASHKAIERIANALNIPVYFIYVLAEPKNEERADMDKMVKTEVCDYLMASNTFDDPADLSLKALVPDTDN